MKHFHILKQTVITTGLLAFTISVDSNGIVNVTARDQATVAASRADRPILCECSGPRKGTGIRTFFTPPLREADQSAAPRAEPSSPAAG